jgi:D-tyrosyl-tRNA(Tyr) deacylase
MRAVVQRVSESSVVTDGRVSGSIGTGLLVYLGVDRDDGDADASYIADKVRHLRIFTDEAGKMNLDVLQAGGKVLVVSAFTVQADARRGRRPAFESAASQDRAIVLYELVCDALRRLGVPVERGSFGDYMDVKSVNAGPICILLESHRAF